MTWMPTDTGYGCRAMEMFGSRITPEQAGRLIRRADGCGSQAGAGPGLATSRGAGRRITMAAGSITATAGAGGLGRSLLATGRCGRPRSSSLSDSDTTLRLALDRLGGSRWGRTILSSPGGEEGSIV